LKSSKPGKAATLWIVPIWALVCLVVGWFWIRDGWFQLELFHISEVLSQTAHNSSLLRQFLVVFDWRSFDVVTARLRPLSDLVEVVDAMMRPLRLFGTHPSLTVIAIVLAAGTVLAFHSALVRMNLSALSAALFTLLLVTTVGFLSCFVPYVRPAKKLVLLCTALAYLFSSKYRMSPRAIRPLLLTVFISFFCDEAGFALWPLALFLTLPTIIERRQWRHALLLFVLPAAYFGTTKWVIPPIYAHFVAPRNTTFDAASYLATLLMDWRFYPIAAGDFASGLLISFGLAGPSPWEIHAALTLFAFGLGWGIWHKRWFFVGSCLGTLVMSFSLTLFDMFNTPFKSNPWGQLTYYYHSPVGLMAIFAVATLELRTPLVFLLVAFVGTLNVQNFHDINRSLMIDLCYPLEARALPAHVVKPEELAREFHDLTAHFQGQNRDWFQNNFTYYQAHPMGDDTYARRYVELFKPHKPEKK
jgi:hypothetical protein